MEKFYKKNSNSNNIEILSDYIKSTEKIHCKCNICDYEWFPIAHNLLIGYGCPQCSGKLKSTTEEFIDKLFKINSNIEVLGEYINNSTKILCKCKIDNYKWEARPNDLLRKRGCPECKRRKVIEINKKTHEQFIKDFYKKNSNANDIEILSKYTDNLTKVLCKCKIDNQVWEATPNNLLNNDTGCPRCNSSKGEMKVEKFLIKNNIKYEKYKRFDDCKFKYPLPFDFYLFECNICIEYDGEDHYKIFSRSSNETYEEAMERFIDRKIRDTIKTIYCKKNNIKLIRISYQEFNDVEEILNKYLLKSNI